MKLHGRGFFVAVCRFVGQVRRLQPVVVGGVRFEASKIGVDGRWRVAFGDPFRFAGRRLRRSGGDDAPFKAAGGAFVFRVDGAVERDSVSLHVRRRFGRDFRDHHVGAEGAHDPRFFFFFFLTDVHAARTGGHGGGVRPQRAPRTGAGEAAQKGSARAELVDDAFAFGEVDLAVAGIDGEPLDTAEGFRRSRTRDREQKLVHAERFGPKNIQRRFTAGTLVIHNHVAARGVYSDVLHPAKRYDFGGFARRARFRTCPRDLRDIGFGWFFTIGRRLLEHIEETAAFGKAHTHIDVALRFAQRIVDGHADHFSHLAALRGGAFREGPAGRLSARPQREQGIGRRIEHRHTPFGFSRDAF